jgi:peptide deformylase
VTVVDPANVRDLVQDLFDTAADAEALAAGLAAPQIGALFAVFVLTEAVGAGPLEVINPEIVHTKGGQSSEREGCLSIPGEIYRVTRPRKVRAMWLDLGGTRHEAWLTGASARAFQHEFDHLRGVLISQIGERVR